MSKKKVLKPLTVGDINAFNRWRKDQYKKEIISITREVHGDNIPDGEVDRINALIQKVKGMDENPKVTPEEIQFLVYRSLLKTYPDMTYESAGDEIPLEDAENMLDGVLPTEEKVSKTKKKSTRKKKAKDN